MQTIKSTDTLMPYNTQVQCHSFNSAEYALEHL